MEKIIIKLTVLVIVIIVSFSITPLFLNASNYILNIIGLIILIGVMPIVVYNLIINIFNDFKDYD